MAVLSDKLPVSAAGLYTSDHPPAACYACALSVHSFWIHTQPFGSLRLIFTAALEAAAATQAGTFLHLLCRSSIFSSLRLLCFRNNRRKHGRRVGGCPACFLFHTLPLSTRLCFTQTLNVERNSCRPSLISFLYCYYFFTLY